MVMLYIIGLGLDDGEITEKGVEALRNVDHTFAEFYTNTKNIDLEQLEEQTGTEIEELSRKEVEQQDWVVEAAQKQDIAFLVSGDPLTATTHYDIKHRAEQKRIEVEVVHAPSILTSVAKTGLNVYKFGRVVTLPEDSKPSSILEYIENNDSIGLHTLVLLDIDYQADKAAEKLVTLGVDEGREVAVIERANQNSSVTVTSLGEVSDLRFGEPPHSIILIGETSHKEEEFLKTYE